MSIQTQGVEYQFTLNKTIRFPDLDCKQNESWLLLGNSGSGKTTFLHLLAGILNPTIGKILVDGTEMQLMSSQKKDEFRGKNIGLILQTPHFLKALTLGENMILAQQFAKIKVDKSRAKLLLSQLGLEQYWDKRTYELSQGEQQRAALARAVLHSPKVILADEPTAALDDDNTEKTVQLLDTYAKETGATLLIVTHDQRLKEHYRNQIMIGGENEELII